MIKIFPDEESPVPAMLLLDGDGNLGLVIAQTKFEAMSEYDKAHVINDLLSSLGPLEVFGAVAAPLLRLVV